MSSLSKCDDLEQLIHSNIATACDCGLQCCYALSVQPCTDIQAIKNISGELITSTEQKIQGVNTPKRQ